MSDGGDDERETVQSSFTMDKSLADEFEAKTEHGEKGDVLRRAIKRYVSGGETSERERLTHRKEELTDELERINEKRRGLDRDEEKITRQLDRVNDRLNRLNTLSGEYEQKLSQIEGKLYDGVRITTDHTAVTAAAAVADSTPIDVVNELKERNPGVPDTAWEPARPRVDEPNWGGCTEADARDPDAEM